MFQVFCSAFLNKGALQDRDEGDHSKNCTHTVTVQIKYIGTVLFRAYLCTEQSQKDSKSDSFWWRRRFLVYKYRLSLATLKKCQWCASWYFEILCRKSQSILWLKKQNHFLKQRKCFITEAMCKWRECHFYKMWLFNCLLQSKTKELPHCFLVSFSFRELCGKNLIGLVVV